MYKHNASSIKETAEKRFISKVDKAKYDAISSDCVDISNNMSIENDPFANFGESVSIDDNFLD